MEISKPLETSKPLDITKPTRLRTSMRIQWGRLFGHLSTLVLSTVMGLIVWLIAINQVNPLVTQKFPVDIPIEVRDLEATLQPTENLSNEYVQLTLRAPQQVWNELDASDIRAYIDLSGLKQGVHDVPIHVELNDSQIDIIGIQRAQLRIELDQVMTHLVPVRVAIMDNPEIGYTWQTPMVTPISVTVSGPAAQVRQVEMVVAPVYLYGSKTQVERQQAVEPRNRFNAPVPSVRASPSFVDVVVPIQRPPDQRQLAVRLKPVGAPASGYRLGRISIEPSTVTVYGAATAVASTPGYVETEPLSLEGATESIRKRLHLILPTGVNAFEDNTVLVEAEILPIEDGKTWTTKPVIQGLGENLQVVTIEPDTVDVILSGPVKDLTALKQDDVYAFLELYGLVAGSHFITPKVVKPEEIRLEGVLPGTVEVVIASQVTTTTVISPTVPLVTPAPTTVAR